MAHTSPEITKSYNKYETHPDAPHLRYMTVHHEFGTRSAATLSKWVPAEYETILKSLTWIVSLFKPEIIANVPAKHPVAHILEANKQKCTDAVELSMLLAILQYGKLGTVVYTIMADDDDNMDPRTSIIPYIVKDGKPVSLLDKR